ncbi:RNA polymerase sigma factor [Rhabdobacter roseus]|uniref:RNA polymerase sigma-70 factor (ECF subfamily) n=1 Tax=Rhabdobacter roseus TaxID=1655419 RepID=A0A840TZE3_9BACT|nr:RNA polymerase sigma factor [Rhabdobacter roseus]MBB5286992.1 RNA polymerase sigma-70 factor (ECF subfamily) [Rhabdobacter roseus]
MNSAEEEKLIKACRSGDGSAFEALYRRFSAKMMAVCYRYCHDRDEAQDLLQEGFIKVFEQIGKFRGEGSFEGWIRRIMVLTALEKYRKDRRVRESRYGSVADLQGDMQPISSDDIYSQMSFDELVGMIQELTPAYRMVFNLYVFEGMKHEEIAEKLGVSVGTSKSNLSDARRILQRRIEKVMYDLN